MEILKKNVLDAWNEYVGTGKPVPASINGVRTLIADSWRRSQQAHVDPNITREITLTQQEFQNKLRENAALIDIAYPYLLELYQFVKGSNYQILLADGEGCLLKCISDDDDAAIRQMAVSVQVKEGSLCTEDVVGTSGVSLCLKLNKPVEVVGPEHFYASHHIFDCCGAPIHTPERELIGCISMMGPLELHNNHTLGMLCSAATGIEQELRLTMINSVFKTALDSFDRGVFVLDSQNNILYFNSLAKMILHLNDEEIKDRNIFELIPPGFLPGSLSDLKSDIESLDCTVRRPDGTIADIVLTVKHTHERYGGLETTLVIFQTQRSLHKLTNRIAGFSANYTLDSIIGKSNDMIKIKDLCLKAAATPSTVLILGESGTGKELVAQAIHNASGRSAGSFVAVNCGSIPKDLIESELFGYESGAFTGAKKEGNPGKFELANGGTVFLDEIGDMPLELQRILLRVLETHEVMRLGSKSTRRIDVKVIAATNVDLMNAVAEKSFRSDLYYRLNVLSISIPPLRKRKDDIPLLLHSFIDKYNRMLGKHIIGISEDCLDILLDYDWPGNVRELENTVERVINFASGNTITVGDLPAYITGWRSRGGPGFAGMPASPEQLEYGRITDALKQEQGHVKTAAALLDMPVSTLYRKLEKYRIEPKSFRMW